MKSPTAALSPSLRAPIAGFLTWLLPGAGHLFIGERVRGIIFMAAIAVTFWTGVAIGGVKNTVNYSERSLWFMGQICAGGHTLAAMGLSSQIRVPAGPETAWKAFGREEEISVVYTAICGMLNVLIIFDVLVRADRLPAPVVKRPMPVQSGKGGRP